MLRKPLIVAIAVGALVIAGCGGNEAPESGTQEARAQEDTAPDDTAVDAGGPEEERDLAIAAAMPISAMGVAGVNLGDDYEDLRSRGLVSGRLDTTCGTSGLSGLYSVNLRGPVDGVAELSPLDKGVERQVVEQIQIWRGAAARGVGVGSTGDDVRDAFPAAHGVLYGAGKPEVLAVPAGAGGPMQFAIANPGNQKVLKIGIPKVNWVCL